MNTSDPRPGRNRSQRNSRMAWVLAALVLLVPAGLALDDGSGVPRWWWRIATWVAPPRPTPAPEGPARADDLGWRPAPEDRPTPWRPGAQVPGHQIPGASIGMNAPAGTKHPEPARQARARGPNGDRGSLGPAPRERTQVTIRIHRRWHMLELYRDSVRVMAAPVGLGRSGRTPLGRFPVVSLAVDPAYRSPSGRIIPGGTSRNPLGRHWIGLGVPGRSGLAIHGTTDPASIGRDRSHGCIRMRDHELAELFRLVAQDVQVEIVP